MTKANATKYDLAQEQIASGLWAVDENAGVIYGTRGQSLGSVNNGGYVVVKLAVHGHKEYGVAAHRVIWEAVHGPAGTTLEVNHIDGDKTNNRITNLELVTPERNRQHAYDSGLQNAPSGEAHGRSRLTDSEVESIRHAVDAGASMRSTALRFGTVPSHVHAIVHGKKRKAAIQRGHHTPTHHGAST